MGQGKVGKLVNFAYLPFANLPFVKTIATRTFKLSFFIRNKPAGAFVRI
jgi:hypothetical protein